ncbi:aminoacyl-tRNA hydrolase [Chloroflexota bacterium]
MKLIVGLGNPGRSYATNRHNIGFISLNYFARAHGIRFEKKQNRARIGISMVAGNDVVVARPQTYMNLSGLSVSQLMAKFKINLKDLLVIQDDLDLPLGKIRIREGSSAGGHKGVESIINYLNSQDFLRLRVGIGRPTAIIDLGLTSEADIITYVLSDFTPDERQVITRLLPEVSEAVLCLLAEGPMVAMNKYN